MKRLLILAVAALMVLAAGAQKVYGDKQGWEAYTTEDEYTGKKSHYMRYYNDRRELAASFFPGPSRLVCFPAGR